MTESQSPPLKSPKLIHRTLAIALVTSIGFSGSIYSPLTAIHAGIQSNVNLWGYEYRPSFPQVTPTDGTLFVETLSRRMNQSSDWSATVAASMYHAQILHYQELRGDLSNLTEKDREDITQKVNSAVDAYKKLHAEAVSRDGFNSLLPTEEAGLILKALDLFPGGEKLAKIGGFLVESASYAEKSLTADGRQVDAQIKLAQQNQEFQERSTEYLATMREMLKSDPALAEKMNAAFEAMFGVPIFAEDQTYYDREPSLQQSRALIFIADQVAKLRKEQRANTEALNRLREEVEASRKEIASKLEKIGTDLGALDSEMKAIEERRAKKQISEEAAKAQLAALQQRRDVLYKEQMDFYAALGVGGQILGNISSLIPDPATARTVRQAAGVMSAVSTIGQAITKFRFEEVTALGTAAMTGNILGAVVTLVGLFSNQKSPEQQILEQLAALQNQVDKFRMEMHERFDRVDGLLLESLRLSSLIFFDLQHNTTEIQKTLDSLLGLQERRLSGLDRKLETAVMELLTANASSAGFKCGKWQREYTRTPMTADRFENDCVYPLAYLGVELSRSPSIALSQDRPRDLIHWREELEKPISTNLEYSRQLVEDLLGKKITGLPTPIPNPAAIITSASSMAAFFRDYREFAKERFKPSVFDEIRDLMENSLQKYASELHSRPEIFSEIGKKAEGILNEELVPLVENHHSAWRLHQGLDSPDGAKVTPIYGPTSKDTRKFVPDALQITPGEYLPKEYKSCDPTKTHGVNLPLVENGYNSGITGMFALSKGPRIIRYAEQLGLGAVTSCYENLKLVAIAKECKQTKGSPFNNRYCAGLEYDQVYKFAGVEFLRTRRKSAQEPNSLAHPGLRSDATYRYAMERVQKHLATTQLDNPFTFLDRVAYVMNLNQEFNKVEQRGVPALEGKIQARLEELRKSYQKFLVSHLVNPIPSGNAQFEVVRRKLEGLQALADTVVQIAYPRSVIVHQGVMNLLFADTDLSQKTDGEVKAFIADERYPNLNAIALRLFEEAEQSPIKRATILPPLSASRSVSRYTGLKTRQPHAERFPVLETLSDELKVATELLK